MDDRICSFLAFMLSPSCRDNGQLLWVVLYWGTSTTLERPLAGGHIRVDGVVERMFQS